MGTAKERPLEEKCSLPKPEKHAFNFLGTSFKTQRLLFVHFLHGVLR